MILAIQAWAKIRNENKHSDINISHMLHVWNIYLHYPTFTPKNGPSVGKYSMHGGIWDIYIYIMYINVYQICDCIGFWKHDWICYASTHGASTAGQMHQKRQNHRRNPDVPWPTLPHPLPSRYWIDSGPCYEWLFEKPLQFTRHMNKKHWQIGNNMISIYTIIWYIYITIF